MSILVHPPLILLAVMFILGVVDIDDQLVFSLYPTWTFVSWWI